MSTPATNVGVEPVDGEPWFVVARILALLDLNRSSVAALDDDEKGVRTVDTLVDPQHHRQPLLGRSGGSVSKA